MPPSLELDLHSLTVDEALVKLDQYLYDSYVAGLPYVRIVHGKGTGALRQAIRKELPKHPLIKSFTAASPREGGEGATIVTLKD